MIEQVGAGHPWVCFDRRHRRLRAIGRSCPGYGTMPPIKCGGNLIQLDPVLWELRWARLISPDSSRVKVRIIRTDEELMIARAATRVLNFGSIGHT